MTADELLKLAQSISWPDMPTYEDEDDALAKALCLIDQTRVRRETIAIIAAILVYDLDRK